MKILLITTGGTIASVIHSGVIDVTQHARLLVLEKYRAIDDKTQFDVISPVNILSENVRVSDYKAIVKAINNTDVKAYDGIIITHGSDTLAYTSALIGLLYEKLDIPIALVASDKPLEDERSNGMDNFICAVEIIKAKMCGVYVPYKNADGVMYIHYATNLLQSQMLSDDFYSVGGAYAVYEDGCISKSSYAKERPKIDVDKADLNFNRTILQVSPYPALDYSRFDIDGLWAVLHTTYHAGTMCADKDDDTSVLSLIRRCKQKGVPFYVCGVYSGKSDYKSLDTVIGEGAIVLYDMSPACAYMKLLLEG